MIKYYAISSFYKALDELKKIRKGVYSGVDEEIKREFSDKTIEQIRSNRDMILMVSSALVIKLRMPDKRQRLSRKDGYRLIYLVSQENDTVVFLTIYAKNGPAQKLNIDHGELLQLLQQFSEEGTSQTLKIYNMTSI